MTRSRSGLAMLALVGLCLAGCDWIHDRLRTCGTLDVELRNDDPDRRVTAILADWESESPETRLAAGASRYDHPCVERGDTRRYRAARDGRELATATCVVSGARSEYASTRARVVWDARGLVCEGW